MITNVGLEQCLSFINCHLQPPRPAEKAEPRTRWRTITISREAGSGAHAMANHLVQLLQAHQGPGAVPWTVFDRNLIEKMLEDHHLPSRLAKFMPEDRISGIADTMDELFGLHPPSSTLVHKLAETALHLAELGNVILIGHGAHVVTANLDYVFHVRLVASLDNRIKYVQERDGLSRKTAETLVKGEDLGRRRFLRRYFGKKIDDPLLYHLGINLDLISHEEAARLIALAVLPQTNLSARRL